MQVTRVPCAVAGTGETVFEVHSTTKLSFFVLSLSFSE